MARALTSGGAGRPLLYVGRERQEPAKGALMKTLLVLSALAAFAYADLAYIETSTGFQGNPVLDGGRSELELADIDNDGNIDILSIGDHGNPYINTQEHGVMVWFGDGNGGWTVFQYGNFGYGGIAVGDVNNDGFWDVGYGMHHDYSGEDLGDQLLEVALGDGTGRMWVAWDDSLAQEGQDWGMFSTDFADIDNDGDLDVGSISFGAGDGIHAYINLGDGSWRRTFGYLDGNSKMEFYFRDVNRDGNADIIAPHGTGSVWFGDGTGAFTPANTGLPSTSYGLSGLSAGDADNDGGCDVSFANSDGGVEVYVWNDQSAQWERFSGTLPTSGNFDGTALCDMDADGFADVVAIGDGLTRVWTGDGAGNWTEAASINTPSPGTYSCIRTGADFDHNGRPDIAFWTREGSWPSDINKAHAFKETSPRENLTVFPVFPRGREKLMDGSVQFIDWWSEAPGFESTRVRLELSLNGESGPWTGIADSLRNNGRFQWLVPEDSVSPDCRIRYTVYGPGGSAQAMTPRPFAIGDTVVAVEEGRTPRLARMRVWPNPARDRVWLELGPGAGRTLPVALLGVDGRRVMELRPGENSVARLSPGVYFVRSEGVPVRKVVVLQ
jgi:hypothetical protein